MEIKLPKLGEGADSGTVVTILVAVGDEIKEGQTLIELENEKAVAPIPSPVAGKVEQIHVQEGQKLSIGQRIASVAETGTAAKSSGEEAPAKERARSSAKERPARAPTPAQPVAKRQSEPVEEAEPEADETQPEDESGEMVEPQAEPTEDPGHGGGGAPAAAPSVRKWARELGIDLERVTGSERGGRIVMSDLRAYIERLQKLAFAPKPSPKTTSSGPAAAKSAPRAEAIDFSQWGPVTRKPLSPLRAVISRRMSESSSTIPQVTQFDEADVSKLMAFRQKYASAFEAKGARLTLTPFMLKAVVTALKQSPIFNASLDEAKGEVVYKDYYHFGMAVDTEAGLIVPVIRDVDRKNILELSKALQDLAERARTRKITAEEMKGGSFTISNQGGIGGAHFTPIINKPEAAILGLGRSVLKPAVRDGKIEARHLMPVCVTYDHRLIDGGSAARFVVQLVQALENFDEAELTAGLK